MELHQQLVAVCKKIEPAKKSKEGHGYAYADLAEVMSVLSPVLWENDLYISCQIDDEKKNLVATVYNKKGDSLSSSCPVDFENALRGSNSMQKIGSAMTYARRYAILNLFNIPCEDDDGASLDDPKKKSPSKSSRPSYSKPKPAPHAPTSAPRVPNKTFHIISLGEGIKKKFSTGEEALDWYKSKGKDGGPSIYDRHLVGNLNEEKTKAVNGLHDELKTKGFL